MNTTEIPILPPPYIDGPVISAMRDAWSLIVTPTEPMLAQLRRQLDILDQPQLEYLAHARIRIVSVLALLRLKMRREDAWN